MSSSPEAPFTNRSSFTAEDILKRLDGLTPQGNESSQNRLQAIYNYRKELAGILSKRSSKPIPETYIVDFIASQPVLPLELLITILYQKQHSLRILQHHHLPADILHQYIHDTFKKLPLFKSISPDLRWAILKQPNILLEDLSFLFKKYINVLDFDRDERAKLAFIDTPAFFTALISALKQASPTEKRGFLRQPKFEDIYLLRSRIEAENIITNLIHLPQLSTEQLLQLYQLATEHNMTESQAPAVLAERLLSSPESRSILKKWNLHFTTLSSQSLSPEIREGVLSKMTSDLIKEPRIQTTVGTERVSP